MPPFLLAISALWSFVQAHWRPFAYGAVVLAAFIGGRCSVRPPAQPAVRATEVSDTHKDEQKHVDTGKQTATQKDEQKTIRVVRDRITKKDGTVDDHSETTETIGTETHATTAVQKTVDDHIDTTSHVAKTVTVTPAPAHMPNWFVGVDLGVPIALKKPFVGTPFVVVHVDRRVIGPISAGVWASIDVHGKNPAAGVSVGVSF